MLSLRGNKPGIIKMQEKQPVSRSIVNQKRFAGSDQVPITLTKEDADVPQKQITLAATEVRIAAARETFVRCHW
jgi:hypothetical protein